MAGIYHQLALLPNNKVLIFGGGTYDWVGCNIPNYVAKEVDITTETLTPVVSTSIRRMDASTIVLDNGKIFTLGSGEGCTASNSAKQSEIYDPTTKTWSYGAVSTNGFGNITSEVGKLSNGKFLFVGGYWNHSSREYAELYNQTTGQFETTGSMSVKRQGAAGGVLDNGKYLIAGGGSGCCGQGAAPFRKSAELYDPATGTWTPTGDMNEERLFGDRAGVSGIKLKDGKFLVVGGCCGTGLTAELYDPATGTWSYTQGNLNYRRLGDARTILLDSGHVLIVGGAYDAAGNPAKAIEVYDPATQTFSDVGNLNVARMAPSVIKMQDGNILVVGGVDGYYWNFVRSMEIITVQFTVDADGDGYPSDQDCNDNDPAVTLGGTYYRDADNDTYGNLYSVTQACIIPSGYVSNSSDCNDNNATINPGATEICNGIDDNCNGPIDDGVVKVSISPSKVWPQNAGSSQTTATITISLTNSAPPAGCDVNLLVEPDGNSGGHSQHTGARPKGKIIDTNGHVINSVTLSNVENSAIVKYTSSEVSGKEKIIAEVNGEKVSEATIRIRVPELEGLGSGDYHVIVRGGTNTHPEGVYGTSATTKLLMMIAEEYFDRTDRKLSVNDLSLPMGGLFDLNGQWNTAGGHRMHRHGTDADINRTDGGGVFSNCHEDQDLQIAVAEVAEGGVPRLICEDARHRPVPLDDPNGLYKHIDFD